MSATRTPIQPASEPPPPLVPREFSLRIDPLLALAAIGLLACSLVALKGATGDDVDGQPLYYVMRQGIFGGIGVLLMLAMARLDYSRLRELKYAVYGLLIGSIVLVMLLGDETRGSKAWIDIGPFFRLQPSEVGKVLLVLSISAFMVDRMRRPGRQTTARVMLLVLVPTILLMAQDLGTSLVFIVGGLALLFVAGAPWKHFAALFALGVTAIALVVAVLPTAGVEVLKPYQKDRLTSFLHPNDVLGREGYQQRQSIIAIGSGEKTGRGTEKADQTGLGFLPEHHTDFIFAVVGETYGFVGAALVLSLYALLIWRGLRILTLAKNLYGALIAGGITLMLLFQTFVNVGMNVGIMPITGVPAPLLSYGGSSLLATFLAIGLLQSIHAQAREVATAKSRGGPLS